MVLENEEISWEPFYAELVGHSESTCLLDLTPFNGTLAPRGGAENACDENKPYSDQCLLTVFRKEVSHEDSGVGKFNNRGESVDEGSPLKNMHLVARTEMGTWTWRVLL